MKRSKSDRSVVALSPRSTKHRKADHARLGAQIALRLDPELLARLDAYVRQLREREPAIAWGRSAAIRSLLMRGLESTERAGDSR
jgi:hypothetical protein